MPEEKLNDPFLHSGHVDESLTLVAKSEKCEGDAIKEEDVKEERQPLTRLDWLGMSLVLLAMSMMACSLFRPGSKLYYGSAVMLLLVYALNNAAQKKWFWLLLDVSYAVIIIVFAIASAEQLSPALVPLLPFLLFVPSSFCLVHYGVKGAAKLLRKKRT